MKATSGDVLGVLRNLDDPEMVMKLSAMRAGATLAKGYYVTSPARARLEEKMQGHMVEFVGADILSPSFLPEVRLPGRVRHLLGPASASTHAAVIPEILKDTITQAGAYITNLQHASPDDQRAMGWIGSSRRNVTSEALGRSSGLRLIKPQLQAHLATSLFANLVQVGLSRGAAAIVEANTVGDVLKGFGPGFRPDVASLYRVYRSFFEKSAKASLRWHKEQSPGENIFGGPLRSETFPAYGSSLALAHGIEWAVSRADIRTVLKALKPVLESGDLVDRWAATQLVERSLGYSDRPDFPLMLWDTPPTHFDYRVDVSGGAVGYGPYVDSDADEMPMSDEGSSESASSGDFLGWVRSPKSRGSEDRSRRRPDNDAPADATRPPRKEPPRFTDVTLLEGYPEKQDGMVSDRRIVDNRPLLAGTPYTLEVALRLKRTGIEADREAPRDVINPRRGEEELAIYVLADPASPNVEIPDPFAKIRWLYNQDSEPAIFPLVIKKPSSAMAKEEIVVRVYDAALNLLDIVRLTFPVVLDAARQRKRDHCFKLAWPKASPGGLHLDPAPQDRVLSIDVTAGSGVNGYKVTFKFLTADRGVVVIPGSDRIKTDDLRNLLMPLRDFWTDLSLTYYEKKLTVTSTSYTKHLRELRRLGQRAWRLLFGDGFGSQKGAPEILGEFFETLQLPEQSYIQVNYSGADDFIFPWNILYPPDDDEEQAVDPLKFWGARYRLEQVTRGAREVVLAGEPFNIVFALDERFENSAEQKNLFAGYRDNSGGRLQVTPPVSLKSDLLAVLKPAAHVYYFYCHGYSPSSSTFGNQEGLSRLKERLRTLLDADPPAIETAARAPLEAMCDLADTILARKGGDEAAIFLGASEVTETDLHGRRKYFEERRPIVFLNMCQSAQLLPSLSSGLVNLFLQRDASAVIGTEGVMTGVFANEFSKSVFAELFAGEDIGTALWKSRRRFLADDLRNPLGLAYTLYGLATVRLDGDAIFPAVKSN